MMLALLKPLAAWLRLSLWVMCVSPCIASADGFMGRGQYDNATTAAAAKESPRPSAQSNGEEGEAMACACVDIRPSLVGYCSPFATTHPNHTNPPSPKSPPSPNHAQIKQQPPQQKMRGIGRVLLRRSPKLGSSHHHHHHHGLVLKRSRAGAASGGAMASSSGSSMGGIGGAHVPAASSHLLLSVRCLSGGAAAASKPAGAEEGGIGGAKGTRAGVRPKGAYTSIGRGVDRGCMGWLCTVQ